MGVDPIHQIVSALFVTLCATSNILGTQAVVGIAGIAGRAVKYMGRTAFKFVATMTHVRKSSWPGKK